MGCHLRITKVDHYTIASQSLGEVRHISVWLPPGYQSGLPHPILYCTDGQAVQDLAPALGLAIASGHCPSVVLIGVHSHPQYRNREYLPGMDKVRFAAHETFFTTEVRHWARTTLGLDPPREECGLFGYSCGAAFVVAVGCRHGDRYGNVIAFSVAGATDGIDEPNLTGSSLPRIYLCAGTKELSFRERTRGIADRLTSRGVEHVYLERAASHDFRTWAAELPEAVQWCYGHNTSNQHVPPVNIID